MVNRSHIRYVSPHKLNRTGILTGLIFCSLHMMAQFTNEFKIGEYVEFFLEDSIRIHFNCTGKVCRQSCADFYRVGRIDPERINVKGPFQDYYLNDSLAFEAIMDSGYIQGPATYYYPGGKVKAKGHYARGKKKGIWKYYYESGELKEILNYVEGFPFVSAYFSKSGRPLVTDGEGKYTGDYRTFRTCDPFSFKGKVKGGVLEGKVKIFNPLFRGNLGYEYYENGKFIRGISGDYNYSNAPKIELPGYDVHEQLMLDENTIYCPGFVGTSFLMYRQDMYWSFYTDFLDSIQKNINYPVADQWLAIGIGVDYNDEIFDVNVFSSINDWNFEKDLFNLIIDMKDWECSQIFWRKINTDLFFTVLITEGRILIPAEILRNTNVY